MTLERGCGRRKPGGLYAVLPRSPAGHPLEEFLQCPPQRLGFDAPVQGQLAIRRGKTLHLLDWIGSAYYPNVADFLEEVRRFGLSRRLSPSLTHRDAVTRLAPLEELSAASRLLCVHARAYLYNYAAYLPADVRCPRAIAGHPASEMCAGLYWWDLEGGQRVEVEGRAERDIAIAPARADLLVERAMPSFTYPGRRRPNGVMPIYGPAIFAAFPISNLVLIRGQHGEHEEMETALDELLLQIPYTLEDE